MLKLQLKEEMIRSEGLRRQTKDLSPPQPPPHPQPLEESDGILGSQIEMELNQRYHSPPKLGAVHISQQPFGPRVHLDRVRAIISDFPVQVPDVKYEVPAMPKTSRCDAEGAPRGPKDPHSKQTASRGFPAPQVLSQADSRSKIPEAKTLDFSLKAPDSTPAWALRAAASGNFAQVASILEDLAPQQNLNAITQPFRPIGKSFRPDYSHVRDLSKTSTLNPKI